MLTETKSPFCRPEIWGGIECTINRTGDNFRDQLADAGHYIRADDIDHFAAMGIAAMRYPVLWEHHQPQQDGSVDWSWITTQLNHLREKNITPIAGLLHHGSGPSGTSLLDSYFPEKLAGYAAMVARQFPWLEWYTPVNEPLTTARFSGLYGCWYPHHTDDLSFIKMLLAQVRGIVLSMQAIRKINPHAKLIQTEDLAKTHSTSRLAYQAVFENHRRWLTYDLLTGRITPAHPLWKYFITAGIKPQELKFFSDNTCPPDIVGFNYYVTSERFLDEQLQHYPMHAQGGNQAQRYADTEAVRKGKMEGLESLLREAWDRYHLPMAVTECHLNCTREEQLRWFKETWDTACRLNISGIPVKAVTAWSLLGAFDWNSLLTQRLQQYEAGVFDISNGRLRPTLLAKMVSDLAASGEFIHPLTEQAGWWKRKRNIPSPAPDKKCVLFVSPGNSDLLDAFIKACHRRAIRHKLLIANENDPITNDDISGLLATQQPWAIIYVEDPSTSILDNLHTNAESTSSLQSLLLEICIRQAMPFMSVHPLMHSTLQINAQALTVAAGPSGSIDVDKALDIFIDGEKGLWLVDEHGICSGTATEELVADQQHP